VSGPGATDRLVVIDGQSLNGGQAFGVEASWPFKVLEGVARRTDVWRPGTGWIELAATRHERVDPLARAAALTVLSMNGGSNDVLAGEAGARSYAVQQEYCRAAKAAGFAHVVTFTLLPSTHMTPAMDAERRSLNDLVLANEDDLFDGVVDLTGHVALSDPSGPLYHDGLHLLPKGHTAVADVARPVFLGLLGH
jgi:hypothetical protein